MPRPMDVSSHATRNRRKPRIRVSVGGGAVTSNKSPGNFRPDVRLDPSQVIDMRGRTQSPLENLGIAIGGEIQNWRNNMGNMIGGRARRQEGLAALRRFNKGPKVNSVIYLRRKAGVRGQKAR